MLAAVVATDQRRALSAHPGVLIAVLCAAGISVSLMQTLIIPLIPELPKLLQASPSNASWAITATLLTAAVTTPVFGRLGDLYGPKPILIACAVDGAPFVLTSLIATIGDPSAFRFNSNSRHLPKLAADLLVEKCAARPEMPELTKMQLVEIRELKGRLPPRAAQSFTQPAVQ